MACDGNIDKRELILIKKLHQEKKYFGEIDIDQELEQLLVAINKDGLKFLKDFLTELNSGGLTEEQELKIVEVAINTIMADEKVEYSEIKFFKVIRSKLKIDNDPILERHPDFEEYLEQDIISSSYLARLQDDFFDTSTLPIFESIGKIGDDLFKK